MTLEPFKYLVQPVALERDDTGRVLREVPGNVLTVYSADQAAEVVRLFEDELAATNQEGSDARVNGARTRSGTGARARAR